MATTYTRAARSGVEARTEPRLLRRRRLSSVSSLELHVEIKENIREACNDTGKKRERVSGPGTASARRDLRNAAAAMKNSGGRFLWPGGVKLRGRRGERERRAWGF